MPQNEKRSIVILNPPSDFESGHLLQSQLSSGLRNDKPHRVFVGLKHVAIRVCAFGVLLVLLVLLRGPFVTALWYQNYPTRSTLITAKHGAVATDEPRCSKIGTDILRRGGNAVDAAVASTLCIGVLQAHSSGIGGGGFMLVRPADGRSPVLIDFRETAGSAATEDMYINNITLAQVGGLAIGVPGEIAGLYRAHSEFGKLPWYDLFEPSIDLARNGFALSSLVHRMLKLREDMVLNSPGFNTTYTNGKGSLLQPGDIVKRSELADTLEAVARDGPRAFYTGSVAESMVRTIRENGGILTLEDFASYQPVDRTPIETLYRGHKVITGSPPTSGSVLINMLNIVEGYGLGIDGQTPLSYHRIAEAMKYGAAHRTMLGDPRFADIADTVFKHLSKEYAAEIRANISDYQTFDVSHYDPEYDILENHGTTHLSILDGDEMAVAVTSTVNLEFGARIMDPATGVILNDEMDDFSTTNQTNGFGLRPSPNNKIVPGKRPLSSTSATVVENNGRVELVIGGSGGSRILTAVFQIIVNIFDFDMRLDNAIDMPRIHHQLLPNELMIEEAFPGDITYKLFRFGHAIVPLAHGKSVVQAVRKDNGVIHAVSDARKHGVASGY